MFNKVLLLNSFVVWFVFFQIFVSANELWRQNWEAEFKEAPALRAGDINEVKNEKVILSWDKSSGGREEVFTSLTCTGLVKRTQGWISGMEDAKGAVMHQ